MENWGVNIAEAIARLEEAARLSAASIREFGISLNPREYCDRVTPTTKTFWAIAGLFNQLQYYEDGLYVRAKFPAQRSHLHWILLAYQR